MQQPSVSLDHHTARFDWGARLRAATIHLGVSVLVATLAALLVFALWYPYPYRELSGGRELFQLVVAVDIVLGPLLTLAVFNRAKPRAELRRDLAVIVALQLAGLAYGLWTVHLARPVHMVFEIDRFRIVHQVDVPEELLDKVRAGVAAIPWGSPTLLALRDFHNENERVEMTIAALQGISLSARPELWQPYEDARSRVLAAARPAAELKSRFPQGVGEIDTLLRSARREWATVAYLPLVGRKENAWTVFLDAATAEVIGYLPLDSF
jgi:hypothetical protein